MTPDEIDEQVDIDDMAENAAYEDDQWGNEP
jgi:hypothetical protein